MRFVPVCVFNVIYRQVSFLVATQAFQMPVVEYYYNKKAWMTSVIFLQFIEKLERKMHRQKRKIILLVDNAPSHSVNDLQLRYVHESFSVVVIIWDK